MRHFLSVVTVCLFLLTTLADRAEADGIWRGGSMYSHFGVGLPNDFRSTYADGMGVYGVALHDNRIASIANPAAWSRTVFTNASGAFEIRSFNAQYGSTQGNSTQFQAGPFQMVLPVSRDRFGVSFSVSPLTSSRYITENEYSLPPGQNHTGGELAYQIENVGSGGINKIEVGFGYRITNSLSFGYAPSLLLGVIKRHQTIYFNNPDYRPVNLLETTSHYGFGNRLGIYYSRSDAFRSNDRAAFGATLSLPVAMVSEKRLESRIDLRDVTINPPSYYGDGNVTFPLEASAGFSYNLNPYLVISSDVIYQNWEGYTNFNGQAESFLNDRLRFGLGSQYIAARRDVGSTFFSNFIYRIGVSYDTGNLTLHETDIETVTIHAGWGIPSSRTGSSIDFNVEYGFRGTEVSDLVSERVFAFKITFNLSELMFEQRRLQ